MVREEHGKKTLPIKEQEIQTKEIKVSTTDPESGFMVRDDKPTDFFYLDHRSVDSRHNLVADTFVTSANVHDSVSNLDRATEQIRF